MHQVSFRIIDGINDKLTISLYLDEAYDKNSVEIIDLQSDIKKNIPQIDIIYTSKEELLEEMRETDPDLVKILERQNPLPETIALRNIPLDKYEALNTIIENKLFVLTEWENAGDGAYFSTYTKQFERIEKVISLLYILQIWLYIILLTFVISIAVIVYSIIGNFIYYYKDEIYITRLVGWSKIFIYGPFSLQGILYVFCAFLISTTLFLILLENIKYFFDTWYVSQIFAGNLYVILILEALLFSLIGWLSGFFSSRKYLKK